MINNSDTEHRLIKLKRLLSTRKLDAVVIKKLPHIRYLTSFTGSNALLIITKRNRYLVTDARYIEQAKEQVNGYKIVIARKGLMEEVKRNNLLRSAKRIGFEANHTFHTELKNYKKMLPEKSWAALTDTAEPLRYVKDATEIETINKAINISESAFKAILPIIKPGVTEKEVAIELSYEQRQLGADGDAFPIIVAGNERGAHPHAQTSDKKINYNELILIDFGCIVNGYHSDITRMISIGKTGREQLKCYNVVLEALKYALDYTSDGIECRKLDKRARSYIKEMGYGRYFNHSLGHGIGLEVHEKPYISPYSNDIIRENVIATIEPGIYIPRRFGIRIEEIIRVENGGCERLTSLSNEIIEV